MQTWHAGLVLRAVSAMQENLQAVGTLAAKRAAGLAEGQPPEKAAKQGQGLGVRAPLRPSTRHNQNINAGAPQQPVKKALTVPQPRPSSISTVPAVQQVTLALIRSCPDLHERSMSPCPPWPALFRPLFARGVELHTMLVLISAGSCSAHIWGQGTCTQVAAV